MPSAHGFQVWLSGRRRTIEVTIDRFSNERRSVTPHLPPRASRSLDKTSHVRLDRICGLASLFGKLANVAVGDGLQRDARHAGGILRLYESEWQRTMQAWISDCGDDVVKRRKARVDPVGIDERPVLRVCVGVPRQDHERHATNKLLEIALASERTHDGADTSVGDRDVVGNEKEIFLLGLDLEDLCKVLLVNSILRR
jgi:hypothetical protein